MHQFFQSNVKLEKPIKALKIIDIDYLFIEMLKVLWSFKNIFETLHDLNDSHEKTKMPKTPS